MNTLFATLHDGGPVAAAFSDEAFVGHCLRFERELAAVQAELGVIPAAAAAEIARVAQPGRVDLAALRQRTATVGLPIVGLVDQLVAACQGDLGQYAHYGATTQDVMDCASVLQMGEALASVEGSLQRLLPRLAGLAQQHAGTLQAGRTNQQHALPLSFGFKVAVWHAGLERHRQRLVELRPRVRCGQFGGAVGTLASFGVHGPETRRRLLARLGLAEPAIAWHAMRDTPTEAVLWLAQLGASLGKMGRDALMLASTEVGELGFAASRGASSTMPQKSNPVAASSVVALAKLLAHTAPMMLDASAIENERSLDAWYIELHALPMAFRLAGALLQQAETMLAELVVDADRMARNAALTGAAIVGESVQMALADHLGLNRAHALLTEAFRTARAEGVPAQQVLARLLGPGVALPTEAFALEPHLAFGRAAVASQLGAAAGGELPPSA